MRVTIVVETDEGQVKVTQSSLGEDPSGQLEAVLNAAVSKVRHAYGFPRPLGGHGIDLPLIQSWEDGTRPWGTTPFLRAESEAAENADIGAAFKAAWHAADQRGEKGHRTEAGLDAVRDLIEHQSKEAGALAEGCS